MLSNDPLLHVGNIWSYRQRHYKHNKQSSARTDRTNITRRILHVTGRKEAKRSQVIVFMLTQLGTTSQQYFLDTMRMFEMDAVSKTDRI
jgi:hypothetical protein